MSNAIHVEGTNERTVKTYIWIRIKSLSQDMKGLRLSRLLMLHHLSFERNRWTDFFFFGRDTRPSVLRLYPYIWARNLTLNTSMMIRRVLRPLSLTTISFRIRSVHSIMERVWWPCLNPCCKTLFFRYNARTKIDCDIMTLQHPITCPLFMIMRYDRWMRRLSAENKK